MLADYFDAWAPTPGVLAVYKNDALASSGAIGSRNPSQPQQQQPPAMRVEDRLLATDKERRSHLQAIAKQRDEAALKECTGRPRIDGRSAALVERRVNVQGRSVVERLTMVAAKSQQQQMLEQQQQQSAAPASRQQRMAADLLLSAPCSSRSAQRAGSEPTSLSGPPEGEPEQQALRAAAVPRINKHSRELIGAQPRGVDTMLHWKAERDRKRREAEDAQQRREAAAATGRPQLNPTSVAIAHNRKVLDGADAMDPVDDILRRHQEHEERMKARYEELYGKPHHPQTQQQHNGGGGGGGAGNNGHAAATAEEVTARLCRDAADRRERREQQRLAAELLSYIDPVTGEVLFQPNTNRHIDELLAEQQQQQHNNEEVDDDDLNQQLAAELARQKHQHRHEPGFWERLSQQRPQTTAAAPGAHAQHGRVAISLSSAPRADDGRAEDSEPASRARHRGGAAPETARAKSPSISQYSRLLAEIRRKRDDETCDAKPQTIYDRLAQQRPATPPASSRHNGRKVGSSTLGFRISAAAATTSASSSQAREPSTASTANHHRDAGASTSPGYRTAGAERNDGGGHDDENDGDNGFRPHLNARSKRLDPRRNERGMARIEALFQLERDRQRAIEQQQLEKQRREEEELARNQMHIMHHHGGGGGGGGSNNSSALGGGGNDHLLHPQQQEAFADRQAAWEARRRQKVLAKQAQKADREVVECTFQPRLAAAPPPSLLKPRF